MFLKDCTVLLDSRLARLVTPIESNFEKKYETYLVGAAPPPPNPLPLPVPNPLPPPAFAPPFPPLNPNLEKQCTQSIIRLLVSL